MPKKAIHQTTTIYEKSTSKTFEACANHSHNMEVQACSKELHVFNIVTTGLTFVLGTDWEPFNEQWLSHVPQQMAHCPPPPPPPFQTLAMQSAVVTVHTVMTIKMQSYLSLFVGCRWFLERWTMVNCVRYVITIANFIPHFKSCYCIYYFPLFCKLLCYI